MTVTNVTWEDEENNRHVEFSVAYAVENQEVTIREITPKSVAFLCKSTANRVRSIGVHTEAGRKMLAHQFARSNDFQSLKSTIGKSCSLTA